jgi:hypothetical protein
MFQTCGSCMSLTVNKGWNETTIQARAEELAEKALEIWISPE